MRAGHPGRAAHVDRELAERPVERAQNSLWIDVAGVTVPCSSAGSVRSAWISHHPQRDPRVGEALAHHGIGRAAVCAREVGDRAQLLLERELLAECRRAPLERERAHRDAPAVVDPADDVRGRGARAVEEGLVELRVPGDLHDRPDLDAGLAHRHEQVREALVLRRRRDWCGRARRSTAPSARATSTPSGR